LTKYNENGESIYLPIDSKFPLEDYQRLLDAQELGDMVMATEAAKQLESRIKAEAKSIRDKYINPPDTTDFAIMFLPIEGLFAEVLRRTGLWETLQREYRVIITGPTTLAALLNSLQMGFRTLAIQKRSSDVWQLLGEVKTEFGRFGDILDKTQKKLQEASNSIEGAATRSRAIERKLKNVQALPISETNQLLSELEMVSSE
jgi:DNA recombination protein RmuC